MSPVALGLDLILAALLVIAIWIGVKLNKKLTGLRDGQANFVKAVQELDQAAARAEAGLASLKAAQDQTHDNLLTRIETARGLINRLEGATTRAAMAAPPAAEPRPMARTAPAAAEPRFMAPSPPLRPQAPAASLARAPRPAARNIDDDLFEDLDRPPVRGSFGR